MSRKKSKFFALSFALLLCVGTVVFCGKQLIRYYEEAASMREISFADIGQLKEQEQGPEPLGQFMLSEFVPVGSALLFEEDHRKVREYQLVKAKGEEEDRHVLLHSLHGEDDDTFEARIANGEQIMARVFCWQVELDDFGRRIGEGLQAAHPEVDWSTTILIGESRSNITEPWILFLVIGSSVWSLVGTLFFIRKGSKDEESWRNKLTQSRSETYRKHPNAMRLVGADEYQGESLLAARSVDTEFDVPRSDPVKYAKTKQRIWKIGMVLTFAVVGGLLHYFINQSDTYRHLGQWSVVAVAIGIATVQALGNFVGLKSVVGQSEQRIEKSKATYRESGFYEYQSKVLHELGLEEVGDYQAIGVEAAYLTRTIFFSRDKNLLVELGSQSGIQYFTLETLLNDGKFLETHSMVSTRHEKNSVLEKHLRRAADHRDIVRALDEHDRFVMEFTSVGGVREAAFSEEKFGRFLAWPSNKDILTGATS